jgi:hypothetical protein
MRSEVGVWNAKVPRKGVAHDTLRSAVSSRSSALRHHATSQRTAPHPSVNTSTEYSLARSTQFHNKRVVGLDSANEERLELSALRPKDIWNKEQNIIYLKDLRVTHG